MMFESLSEKLSAVFKNLRRKGKLSAKDIALTLREIRLALLEADVNFKVVKEFTQKIKERAEGKEVLESLTPAQQVVKIVHEELIAILGKAASQLERAVQGPTVVMLVGLQGSGKTTTVAKLAKYLSNHGHRPLMVAADIYRPAAIHQLKVLGDHLKLPVFDMGSEADPVDVVKASLSRAKSVDYDTLVLDTAGRLTCDAEMMAELSRIKKEISPVEILLILDAMTGQDAVNTAEAFNRELSLTGVILTKLDGDARGGAALSIKMVTGCPIKFVGVGEKIEALEPFYPDRMAGRILGMGDVLTLIEKAERQVDEAKAKELERKLLSQQFTLEDFLEQIQQLKLMGPIDQMISMIPGMGNMVKLPPGWSGEREMAKVEAIINSMTREERQHPEIIKGSRKKRIAAGSGTQVNEINRLLNQFHQVKSLMKNIGKKGKKGLFSFIR
ncbi:MAG: signal recognition particle protein [bacterium]